MEFFYHLVNKDADISLGLVSLEYMFTHHMTDLYDKSTEKYRLRLVSKDGWNIYSNKSEKELTRREVYDGINNFRRDIVREVYNGINKFHQDMSGNNRIYFFKFPPYNELGYNMKNLLKLKNILRIDIEDAETKKWISDIDWGYNNSFTGDKKLDMNWYKNISYEDYFKKYNDSSKMIFASLNHIAIIPRYGYIPRKCLTLIRQ